MYEIGFPRWCSGLRVKQTHFPQARGNSASKGLLDSDSSLPGSPACQITLQISIRLFLKLHNYKSQFFFLKYISIYIYVSILYIICICMNVWFLLVVSLENPN